MTDEEVIKRRLLIDGDGTGDDRRLNVLLKTFIKWCSSNESPENTAATYDRMQAQLAQCEFAVTKSDFATKMMQQELKNYESISQTIEKGIELAKVQIEHSKENLVLAKKIRKNRMEYDVLSKVINQQPDRKKTLQQLDVVKGELNQLQDTRRVLQRKLAHRRKEFLVLMRSIRELQATLQEDEEASEDEDTEMAEDTHSPSRPSSAACSPDSPDFKPVSPAFVIERD
ncbi:THO complex subunit 7 homolog [Lutzomyia longipalpis]|uniref:Putative mrna processing n=1 Tax=Lutzomyia longipalpis TaxID=7200 RepID=A0A1B0GI61_LUTLO|nr:THO complex subunit 7 homolog [Lutzomyia longipalpis]